jgi:uncharacterized protein (TIGR02271 family)
MDYIQAVENYFRSRVEPTLRGGIYGCNTQEEEFAMPLRDDRENTFSSATTPVTIAGLFHDDSQAEDAIEELHDAGFSESEIGIATSRIGGANESSPHESFWDKVARLFGKHEHGETRSELQGTLDASGVPEPQSEYFNRALDEGDILVTVRTSTDRAEKARLILEKEGAELEEEGNTLIGSRAERSGLQDEQRIHLVSEVLRVHKERVQRGEVRLRKEVVTETQNVEVPVTREELVVERVPVEGREAGSDEVGSGEQEIRVPLTEERVRVEKKPVVNEEIRVGKRQVEQSQRVSDTVRHEELRSEEQGDVRSDELSKIKDRKRRTA